MISVCSNCFFTLSSQINLFEIYISSQINVVTRIGSNRGSIFYSQFVKRVIQNLYYSHLFFLTLFVYYLIIKKNISVDIKEAKWMVNLLGGGGVVNQFLLNIYVFLTLF